MSRPDPTEAEIARLRTCRLVFETAVTHKLTMAQARIRLARERWREADARLGRLPAPAAPSSPGDENDAQLAWWQR